MASFSVAWPMRPPMVDTLGTEIETEPPQTMKIITPKLPDGLLTLCCCAPRSPVSFCAGKSITKAGDIMAACSRGSFRRTLIAIFAGVVSLTLLSGKTAAQTTTKASGVKEGIIKLADSNIEYFSRGEGETIVLLPGGTLTVDYLDGLAEELAKGGYRVVGINFRGSGKSTGPSTGVTLQTMANDVAGVIQALKLGSVHVVGNDFGNRVARVLGSSHPELTRSVILLAAGGKVPPKPPAARALNVIFNPASSDAEVLAAMKYMLANPADAARVCQILKPCRAPEAAGIEEAAAKATPLTAWWAPPGQTKYLILQGADDQIAPPENGVLLQQELGGRATLVNVPGAGHLLPLEKTQTTASHMISFIRQLDGKS
jgi:pimeloyl-ACP methyl ester carboxylesterase